MASNRMRRVAKEIDDIHKDKHSQIFVESDGSDITKLRASFPGPPDTPYEGGTYLVNITIPNEYPFRPPVMKFSTKLWHPNISSQTGAICLDTLGSAWSPVLTIKSALLSLQSLLSTPEPTDPQDAEVASMLMNQPREFEEKAREWAVLYAGAPRTNKSSSSRQHPTSQPQKTKAQELAEKNAKYQGYNHNLIDRFVGMGFTVERVVEAFKFYQVPVCGGRDFELQEHHMSEITARLLGEGSMNPEEDMNSMMGPGWRRF